MANAPSSSTSPAARLRELLAGDRLVVAPGAYDCLTARMIQDAGFPAVYMTGAGTAACSANRPAASAISSTESSGFSAAARRWSNISP